MRTSPHFRVATRGTSREINRSIVLNLVRAHQPISRADLARMMNIRRGAISRIVNDLISDGVIFEGATGQAVRGRKPTFLYIDSRRRAVVAADIRASETFMMLADLRGNPTTGVVRMPTARDPRELVPAMAEQIKRLLVENREIDACDGLGVVVPGMVEHSTMRVLHAPTLGWRDVDLREPLAAATGLPVQIENSGRACALAQAWAVREAAGTLRDVVFVSVSDGVGVGVMIHGELLRGRNNVAGEFGHIPISLDGPRCSCGANGCWEAYISNRATLARYFGQPLTHGAPVSGAGPQFTIDDLIARARGRDTQAAAALESTARYLGIGLAAVINTFDPACVYIGGEITRAWDLIEPTARMALAERALTAAAAATDVRPVGATEYPRLRGAAALVVAPAYAVRGVA
ncbi:MAG: ROK family transcriptional regulator [Acidobacteria bacterium]|nr:MAG: ROK family transcriptional regulator [Acidobacteriota bacterium]